MSVESSIEEIVANAELRVSEKAPAINRLLSAEANHGADTACEILRKTKDPRVASFAANHLALFAEYASEKNEIASDILEHRREIIVAVTNLVRFLQPELVEKIVAAYLHEPAGDLYNLAYEVATWFPSRLREHFSEVTDSLLRLGMLSGGPDNWAQAIAERYRNSKSVDALDSLGRMHTPFAVDRLRTLAPEVSSEHHENWKAALNNCGADEATKTSLISKPAFMGFVAPPDRSHHRVGGPCQGMVPQCLDCDQPGYLVLSLHGPGLPFDLRIEDDLEFFWFSCQCDNPAYVNIRGSGEQRQVLIGAQTAADDKVTLLPEAASLQLVEHPNQSGISLDAGAGLARHQVGGNPHWMHPIAFPVCLSCQKPMRFVAQIDSGMTIFGPLSFKGILYCFWCNECQCSTTFQQKI